GWQGIGAPANTPTQIIAILNKLVNEALASAEFEARFVDLGLEPYATSPGEFGKFIVEYTEKWGKVMRDANIRPQRDCFTLRMYRNARHAKMSARGTKGRVG